GFFYSRYPEPPKGKVLEAALSGQAIYYHRAGTPQSEDKLIHERKDLPTWFLTGSVTEDGKYLLVFMQKGSDNNNRLYYSDLGDPMKPTIGAPVKPLIEDDDAEFSAFANSGPVLFLRSDRQAPNRKVIAVDVRDPKPSSWKTVVPESKEAIEGVVLIGGRIVTQYLADVRSRLSLFGLDGTSQGEIELPGIGTVAGLGGREDTPQNFFSFRSALGATAGFFFDFPSPLCKPLEVFYAPTGTNKLGTRHTSAT